MIAHFGSVEAVMGADIEALSRVPGSDQIIATRIRWAMREVEAIDQASGRQHE